MQLQVVRSIAGLQRSAHIVRPGYAIEYDYYDPRALKSSLEAKAVDGSVFRRVRSTGRPVTKKRRRRGCLAGVKRGACRWRARRRGARRGARRYLGVLVDDLITRGVAEPYRMFTSRAGAGLSLREDNADVRLTEIGRQLGCVDDVRWDAFCRKRDAVAREVERLRTTWVNPHLVESQEAVRVFGQPIEREYTLADLLKRPQSTYAGLMTLNRADGSNLAGPAVDDATVAEQVEISIKYAGYIARQEGEVARLESNETTRIPASFNYDNVRGLSFEVAQKLSEQRPETIGQASRISGVTPAAISLLLVHIKRLGHGSSEGRLAA